jgi:hypothetical protein
MRGSFGISCFVCRLNLQNRSVPEIVISDEDYIEVATGTENMYKEKVG